MEIKYTPQGFSYVDITIQQCFDWGGMGICNGCGEVHKNLKLVYVLADTYCEDCFNNFLERSKTMSKEDIEYDLDIQKDNDIKWYKNLLEE